MNYLAYHFEVTPVQPGSEILIAFIEDFGFESFDYTETGFTAYRPDKEEEELNLEDINIEGFTFSYKVERIQETNWNAEWEKNFEPVVVKDLLCIRAPFHPKNHYVKYEIVIMPKMSFGTGHHQTTRLMCQCMATINLKKKRILDMGTGTGILAIFAKQLGAESVLGIDIDEWSVENAIENCASNQFPDIIIRKGDVDFLNEESPFEIILANINKNILKSHLPVYASKLQVGGKLLLSGFFMTDTEELQKLSESLGIYVMSIQNENEWAMILLEKK